MNGISSIQRLPSNTTDLLDVILAGRFVGGFEEAGGVFAEPLGQLVEFFAEPVDGLLVHVCLGDELGEGDWEGMFSFALGVGGEGMLGLDGGIGGTWCCGGSGKLLTEQTA